MTWTTMVLPVDETWALERLLTHDEPESWPPSDWPLATIRELVTAVVAADTLAEQDQPVVTPGGLSRETGQVMRTTRDYAGRVYLVGGERGLNAGDLLVPAFPAQPALLLGTDHVGLAFAGTFHALRATDRATGEALWAMLSSTAGQQARRRAAVGATAAHLTRSRLLEMLVPQPPVAALERLAPLLHRAQRMTATTGDVDRSWWRTARLPNQGRWDLFVTAPEPKRLLDGVRLGELCAEIKPGRDVRPHSLPAPRPGWLPVYTSQSVRRGRAAELWVAPEAKILLAQPGDVLIPAVGLSASSMVCSQGGAVDRDVLLCRLHEPANAERLTRYLNSDAGQALRRVVTVGSVIPRLTATHAREMPTDLDSLQPDPSTATNDGPRSLGEQLDGLIWS